MKKILYTSSTLVLIGALLVMGGCKKTPVVTGFIASQTETNSPNGGTPTTTVTTNTFDSQNRLVEQQATSTTPVTLAYSNGQVTVTQGSNITIYTLNSAGYATSDNNGYTYVYDNNGYNTTASSHAAGATTSVNTISNGDLQSSAQTTNGATTTYSYTYLTTVDYRSNGVAFLGKNSTHLVNTLTVSAGTNNTTVYTFSYTFDSKGRVQTQSLSSVNGTDIISYTYTN